MSETHQNIENIDGEAEQARPYARAVFEMAKSSDSFERWNNSLGLMAAVASNDTMKALLDNPRLTRSDAGQLVIQACGDDIGEKEINLLNMLADNGRLNQLPMIDALYRSFRDDEEGMVDAEVRSATPLTDEQKTAIASALKKRIGRDVILNCSVDEELLGGVVIRAGDLVIDGSAVEHLRQLASALVH